MLKWHIYSEIWRLWTVFLGENIGLIRASVAEEPRTSISSQFDGKNICKHKYKFIREICTIACSDIIKTR